jgi:ribosomal protein S18 acetylase RimI-like enzyme
MRITRNDRVRMERAHVLAWPALRTAVVDGWLWRSSGGGSQRANSVSTIDFTGNEMQRAIGDVEARYRAVGAPARFHVYDETMPVGLSDALRQRGYQQGEQTITMFHRNERVAATDGVERYDRPWAAWEDVYFGAITESRRAVNAQILGDVPSPCGFFGYRGVATALCVIGFGCAVVECVATRQDGRRQGAGRAVMSALLAWAATQDADLVGLQVVADNVAAVRLYESLGFIAGATNQFWVQQAAPAADDHGRNGQDQTISPVPAIATSTDSGSPSRA